MPFQVLLFASWFIFLAATSTRAQEELKLEPPANIGSTGPLPGSNNPELESVLQREAPGENDPTVARIQNSVPAESTLDEVITMIVLDNLPYQYTEDKKWGKQTRQYNGFKVRREGLKLETKRQWKMVNDGNWEKYTVDLIDPQKKFTVHVDKMRNGDDGRLAFDIKFSSPLKIHARNAKWVRGVQLFSISADATATIHLTVSCHLAIRLIPTKFPPDIVFEPDVSAADIKVDQFKVHRVSKLGGEFAQQVTRGAKNVLSEKVASKEKKIVEKINKKIAENKDDLQVSLSDVVESKWTKMAKKHLPFEVQSAIESEEKK